jgi:hypothetical protein
MAVMQHSLFDAPPTGDLLRDEALAKVERSNSEWMEQALSAVRQMNFRHYGREVTGEEIRQYVSDRLPAPLSPNAWGALVATAVKRGWLVDTGRTAKPKDPRSHASRKPLWRWA